MLKLDDSSIVVRLLHYRSLKTWGGEFLTLIEKLRAYHWTGNKQNTSDT
jgi:hypothetical protein